MSELFCIKRDDADVQEYTKKLRNDKETCDVTLVGSDGGMVPAHRNVLIVNSMYIRDMLRRNTSLSPALWIPNLSSEDLCRMLDFIYFGKIFVNVDDMENFIRQSKLLKVKGMINDTYTVDIQSTENVNNHSVKDAKISLEENVKSIKEESQGDTSQKKLNNIHLSVNSYPGVGCFQGIQRFPISSGSRSSSGKPPPIIYLRGQEISKENLQTELMKLCTQLRKDQFKCKSCHYVAHSGSHIREHVERHVGNLVYKCRICSRMSKNSTGHRAHFNKGKCTKNFSKLKSL